MSFTPFSAPRNPELRGTTLPDEFDYYIGFINRCERLNWPAFVAGKDHMIIYTDSYNYKMIRETNAIKNLCIQKYLSHPKFIEEFLQTHDMDELDSLEEWVLNYYVC